MPTFLSRIQKVLNPRIDAARLIVIDTTDKKFLVIFAEILWLHLIPTTKRVILRHSTSQKPFSFWVSFSHAWYVSANNWNWFRSVMCAHCNSCVHTTYSNVSWLLLHNGFPTPNNDVMFMILEKRSVCRFFLGFLISRFSFQKIKIQMSTFVSYFKCISCK